MALLDRAIQSISFPSQSLSAAIVTQTLLIHPSFGCICVFVQPCVSSLSACAPRYRRLHLHVCMRSFRQSLFFTSLATSQTDCPTRRHSYPDPATDHLSTAHQHELRLRSSGKRGCPVHN
ncbi:unnamed protein product [Protopolystoma xenopodis]|uniref:Uncharacterized protein n=1 Tax=Protopolystoma xenopodis TaxID=117903 RepID=A0A3S5CHR7_9PLAT|nr:unnamed protein product [Protopolystoma xenopodis]